MRNKEVSEENLTVTDEDRQILLSLLHEYTDKLTDVCLEIEKRIKSSQEYRKVCYFMGFLGFLNLFVIWKSGQFYPYHLVIITSLYLIILGLFAYLKVPKARGKIIENKAKLLAIKLEKLIRITSQFQENVEKSYAHKIELDLRLTDAETALLYYQALEDQLMTSFLYL